MPTICLGSQISKTRGTGFLFSVVFGACILASCSQGVDPDSLPPIPEIAFETFEPAVRVQMADVLGKLHAAPLDAEKNGQAGMVAHVYRMLGEAGVLYTRALLIDPNNYRWFYYRAIVHQNQGKLESAVADFRGASALAPGNVLLQIAAADALFEAGDADGARAEYERLIDAIPDRGEMWYGYAHLLRQLGDLEPSNSAFQKVIEIWGHHGSAYLALSQNYRQLGNSERAGYYRALAEQYQSARAELRDELGEALTRLDKSTTTRERLVRQLVAAEEIEKAVELLEEAVTANPGDVAAHIGLVGLYSGLGDEGRAEAHIADAMRLAPERPKLHFNIGTQRMRQQRFEDAIASFQTAAMLDPEDVDNHLRLGFAYEKLGEIDKAIRSYRTALAKNAGHREANFLLGRQLAYGGDYSMALTHLAAAAQKRDAKRPMYLNMLATVQLESGEITAAYNTINEANATIDGSTDAAVVRQIRENMELIHARYSIPGS